MAWLGLGGHTRRIGRRIGGDLGRLVTSAFVASLLLTPALAADGSRDAWHALVRGGHVALIRHGNAPGPSLGHGGDPPGFKLNDCRTQRNLDEIGRGQARALGDALRERGVRVDRIQSSPWCRCMETAKLMAVGRVKSSRALVPPTDENPNARRALRALQDMIASWRGRGTLVLVTHGQTAQALLGIKLDQGETVVLKPVRASPSGAEIVGRIPAPAR